MLTRANVVHLKRRGVQREGQPAIFATFAGALDDQTPQRGIHCGRVSASRRRALDCISASKWPT